jgi:hypothetical protein
VPLKAVWAAVSVFFVLAAGCDGQVSYQPAGALPIQFTLDSHGHFSVQAVKSIVTPIGQFQFIADLSPTPAVPDGTTVLYIDHDVNGTRYEDRFQINTEKDLDVAIGGHAVLQIRQHFIRITAQDDITEITVGAAGSLGTGAMEAVPITTVEKFGARTAPFGLTWDGEALKIAPPLGQNRYAALWGAYIPITSCATEVDFDVSVVTSEQNADNMGFAVAPRGGVANDQPTGASVQYEQESPPDFPVLGSFVRPAQLPEMAWAVETPPMSAPDVNRPRHVRVTGLGSTLGIQIDGRNSGMYQRDPTCGGVAIRAWGAAFTFTNITIRQAPR